MREYLNLGPVPVAERHQVVGCGDYDQSAALAECERYRTLLSALFPQLPGNARFGIVAVPHGLYPDPPKRYTVVFQFNSARQDEVEFASQVEQQLPTHWTAPLRLGSATVTVPWRQP